MSDETVLPQSQPTVPGSTHIPRWAKVLAALSATALVLGLIGGGSLVVWFRKASIDSLDPAYIAATLHLIGDFPPSESTAPPADAGAPSSKVSAPDAAPDLTSGRYTPVYAIRLGDINSVSFVQGKDKQQFVLFSYLAEVSDPDKLEEIDHLYEKPAVSFTEWGGKYISVADKGKADINGRQFNYQTGLIKDIKGVNHKSLIGCLNRGRKVVAVEAVAAKDQAVNVDEILDFLRKAKSF